jgi:hypothetical protein
MVVVKFIVRQKDHLVPTLVCAIQFTLGTMCLMVIQQVFLVMLRQGQQTILHYYCDHCIPHYQIIHYLL